MHRSRLYAIVIDCNDLDDGVRFWGEALGLESGPPDSADDPYRELRGETGNLHLLLQRVPEPKTAKTRVHLDIATDDVAAEVRRIEALGAQRQQQIEDWWIMLDPFGNEFCVVPVETARLGESAHTWNT